MITAEIPHNKALEVVSITRSEPHIAPWRNADKGPESSASFYSTGRSFSSGGQISRMEAEGPIQRGEETLNKLEYKNKVVILKRARLHIRAKAGKNTVF
jgi:hypothetical protein